MPCFCTPRTLCAFGGAREYHEPQNTNILDYTSTNLIEGFRLRVEPQLSEESRLDVDEVKVKSSCGMKPCAGDRVSYLNFVLFVFHSSANRWIKDERTVNKENRRPYVYGVIITAGIELQSSRASGPDFL